MESSDHIDDVEHDDQNGHEEETEEGDGEVNAEEDVEAEGDEEEHVEDEHVEDDEEHVEDEEQAEGEEQVEGEEEVEGGEEQVEGEEEVEGDEQEEIEADEDAGGEEDEADDDHEIQDDEEEEGDEGGEGDAAEVGEEENAIKKFPSPMENIGNFDAIEDAEIKQLMGKSSLKLYDGSLGLLLSRGPKYSDAKWPFNCHICYESGINSLKDVKEHLKSARHVRMLRWRPTDPKYKHMKAFRQPFDDEDPTLTPIFIYPGEVITDITPDLLDRVITKDKVPERELADMIGLSYGYKMKRFGKEIYDCVLCRKLVSVLHFAGQKHMDKYIDIHFPKTWKKLRNMIKDGSLGWSTALLSQQQRYIREAVRQIYKKLEEEKGVRQPKFVNYRDFKINRFTYQKQARNKKHYDEKTTPLTDEVLTDYLKQAHEKLGDPKTLIEEDKEKEEKERARRRSSSRDRKARRARIIENDPQVWDRYRRMVGAIMDDLEEVYNKFRKDLESHPKYKSEWKKFWHNRADELERDGIDPHTYDFNKEWIPYWEKRLQEFQAKEIVRHKFETKRKLNLSYDLRSPSPVRRRRRSSPRRRSPSPRSRHMRRRSREQNEPRSKRSRRVDDEPLTVCGVMRIATALEDNLGSLGPQAVQLLSRAVLTEKSNPNPDSLLLENDYYIFFMTAKEKLKGQLIANIIEPRKIHAVDRAVDQISAIINRFEDFRARHGGRGMFGGAGPDGNQNRYQFSGGQRGGVWQTGNYRGENAGGNAPMPPNQNYNRSMAPNSYGDVDSFAHQGQGAADFGNRGGNMPIGGNRQMSGGQYGRMDVDNGTGPNYGPSAGNYGANRGYGGNEGFGGAPFRGEGQRDAPGGPNPSGYGSTRGRSGAHPGKGDISMGRNHMQMGGSNRQSGANAMDYGDGMNRGGSGNQVPFHRGNRSENQMENMAQTSFGGGSSGTRPWSSGYHQSEMPGAGSYGGGMNMGSNNNWNSGDFGGTGGSQSYNSRSNAAANPPACYRNVNTGGRY